MKKIILFSLFSFMIMIKAEISKGLCLLPNEIGSVEHVTNVKLKDISGTWYAALIDKDVFKGYVP